MHYAAEPVEFDRTVRYEQGVRHKPVGLWVSVAGDDDWPEFCEQNGFDTECLAHPHTVTLTAGANILRIESPDELVGFHHAYAQPDDSRSKFADIDWRKVATDYDGIIIAPYQWSMRLGGPFWYYGWDCASGCIWNLDAIGTVCS